MENGNGASPVVEGPAGAAAPKDEAAEIRRERDEFKDKYLRAQAECANIARRLNQQHAEEKRIAAMGFARDLLPVLDNFDRTLASLTGAKSDDPILQGVRLVADQLKSILRAHGIESITCVGAAFDPERHQALMQDFDADAAPGTVTRELERGYQIHDRVLRPAKVSVAARREPKVDPAAAKADAN